MPSKNIIRSYIENGYYHIYNRGVEKREIFLDDQDYKVFLHFLKRYLTKPPESPDQVRPPWRSDLFDKLRLTAYCLMNNHFHLMIKQSIKEATTDFMRALTDSYVRYFNEKYERIGPLFQGRFKAVLIDTESYLLHLTRYIHLNPIEPNEVRPADRSDLLKIRSYPFSSYQEYLGNRKTEWIYTEEILSFFKSAQKSTLHDILSYQSFVEDYALDSRETLGSLTLE